MPCRYFLYSISHPGKTGVPSIDLSEGGELNVSAIERVIMKVFAECSITADISERVRVMFKSKLWRMGQALSKLGGTKRLNLLEKWKDTSWSFFIDTSEVNKQLTHRKHQLEEKLENEK